MDPENSGVQMPGGREGEFVSGSETARQPEFSSVQQGLNSAYRRTSTLDNLTPSVNGMTSSDVESQMFGLRNTGMARDTADRSMLMKMPSSQYLYRSLNSTFG